MSTVDPWLTPPGQVAASQRDANALFSLMHDVLAAEEARQRALDAAEPTEQRSSERRAFSCLQLLAPFDGARMPSQAEFAPQRCHDLSPSGFSFWRNQRLCPQQVIVALGEVPFSFFVAEIIRQDWQPQHNAWLIGCRFIRRIE
jgi:hypothetical protein